MIRKNPYKIRKTRENYFDLLDVYLLDKIFCLLDLESCNYFYQLGGRYRRIIHQYVYPYKNFIRYEDTSIEGPRLNPSRENLPFKNKFKINLIERESQIVSTETASTEETASLEIEPAILIKYTSTQNLQLIDEEEYNKIYTNPMIPIDDSRHTKKSLTADDFVVSLGDWGNDRLNNISNRNNRSISRPNLPIWFDINTKKALNNLIEERDYIFQRLYQSDINTLHGILDLDAIPPDSELPSVSILFKEIMRR